jgi:hypothetical protein
MKFMLTLYLYSTISGSSVILERGVSPQEYLTYYDCVSDGYITAYTKIMSLGVEQVDSKRLSINFECKQINNT